MQLRTTNANPVPPGRKRTFEQVDLKTYRTEEDYADFFSEGDAFPVSAFLTDNGYSVDRVGDEAKQVAFAREDWSESESASSNLSAGVGLEGDL